MEEEFFKDESIIEQSTAMIRTAMGTTNGISLIVDCGFGCVEILLEYHELVRAVEELGRDRLTYPYDY